MKKQLLILTTIAFIGCGSLQKSVNINNYPDVDGDGILDSEDPNPNVASELSLEDWKNSRDLLINDWQQRLTSATQNKNKLNKSFSNFTIGSTIVGVGSGIYGLVDDNNLVPSIGSMLVGASATLVSQLNLNKRKEKSDRCYYTIQRELSTFKVKWSDINFPDTPIKLLNYNSDKIEIINKINKDCLN